MKQLFLALAMVALTLHFTSWDLMAKSKSKAPRMTLTKLTKKVAKKERVSQKQTRAIIKRFLSEVTKSLKQGKKVNLRGFGTFYTSRHQSRTWKHPKTKKVIQIPSRLYVKFRSSRVLKDKMNRIKRKKKKSKKGGKKGVKAQPAPSVK